MGTVRLSSSSKERSSTKAPAAAPTNAIRQSSKRARAMRKATRKKAAVPSMERWKILKRPKFFPPSSAAVSPKDRKNMAVMATLREKKKITTKKARHRKVDPLNRVSSVWRIKAEKYRINFELNSLSLNRRRSNKKETPKQTPDTHNKKKRVWG